MSRLRLPRALHPAGWWLWALALATAAARTTNAVVLLLIVAVVGLVVAARRSNSPWSRAFRVYLLLGAAVVAIRVVFRVLLGAGLGERVLFTLPTVPLPDWAAGIVVGGPVTLEGILAAGYDGLRLATLIICIGAANALADPRRLLRMVPRALHDVGAAIVVAISLVPQLIATAGRVRQARRLRGAPGKGMDAVRSIAVPVLEGGLDRSLALAAAMDARGYGHHLDEPVGRRRVTAGLVLAGLVGICLGLYGLLDAGTDSPLVGVVPLFAGCGLAVAALATGGRRIDATVYRPDPWQTPEWTVAGAGVVAVVLVVVAGAVDPAALHPSLQPLTWPTLPVPAVVGVLVAALPAVAAPPTRLVEPATRDVPRSREVVAGDPVR